MPLVMLELLASAAGMRRMHAGAQCGPAKTLVDWVLAFALPDGPGALEPVQGSFACSASASTRRVGDLRHDALACNPSRRHRCLWAAPHPALSTLT